MPLTLTLTASAMAFVHLHTHSEYPSLDGASRIPELVAHVKKLGMDSLAVTDHGNMHAAWSFYEEAKAQKIRPFSASRPISRSGPRQAREKPRGRAVRLQPPRPAGQEPHRVQEPGPADLHRVHRGVLPAAAHRQGVPGAVQRGHGLPGRVPLGRGVAAPPPGQVRRGQAQRRVVRQAFGPDGFWLEVQQHGIAEERLVTEGMLRLGRELGIGVVATNDAHYLRREDAESHDVLLAIGTGSDLDDPKRFRFTGEESYVKSEKEMAALFPDAPGDAGQHPDGRRPLRVRLREAVLPARLSPPRRIRDRRSAARRPRAPGRGAALRHAAPARGRASGWPTSSASSTPAGYAGYFLIVQDFIAAARERGIPVGPGRGSAAGSIVAYALGITNVCPLKFDLLFERFLNPERVSMPDIDVDFCFERRGEVIEYVRQRYGRGSVGQIVTFGTMKARAAVKDVARVLRIPPGEADRITKLIPSGPAYSLTIPEAEKKVDELRDLVKGNPAYRRLLDLSSRIEGISRHMSVHAAGVVIAPGPLAEYVPVCTAPTKGAGAAADGEESIITQYEMGALEKVGMLKMDMLGLKTLTVIHDAGLMIAASYRRRRGHGRRWRSTIPRCTSCCARGGPRASSSSSLRWPPTRFAPMQCDRFDDLVASNALLRPGPLDAGMHTVFIRRKLGQEKVTYPHPSLQEVLEPTYGVITYQEQVMRIANVLAGFTLAEADVLRKAVGKKDAELIKKELGKFCRAGDGAGPSRGGWWTTWPRRSRPSAGTASTSRTRWRTRCSRTRPRGSRPTTPPSSWRRCSRRKSATPTRWCSTSTRRASWSSRCCLRT